MLLAAGSAAILAAGPVALAPAQDTAAPAPCTGVLLTDAPGDDDSGPNSLVGGPPTNQTGAAPYLDIRNVFFNFKAGVLTANIQVTDLTPAIPNGSYEGAIEYVVEFDHIGETVDWLQAIWDGSAWTFQYGAIESMDMPDGLARSAPTETTGRVFPGANGIVQIDVPADGAAAAGTVVENVHAYTGMWMPTLESYGTLWFYSDMAPDEGDNPSYTVADCPAGAAAAGDGGQAPTQPTDPNQPNQPNQPAQPQPQPQQQQAAAPATLPFKASSSLGSARKAVKKKRLSLKASSTRPISGLVVQIKKGRKVVATGKRASLNGSGRLTLKVKGKKLKRGRYTLLATGTVDGRRLSATQVVSFKK